MPKPRQFIRLLNPALGLCILGAMMLIIGACGQRGPLYLPKDKQPGQGGLRIETTIQEESTARPVKPAANTDIDKPKSSSN